MASKKEGGSGSGGSSPDGAFETLYRQLETTVAKLEEGNLTLEQSIGLYEEGMKLARRCQELLEQAELRITRLQESFANSSVLREEPEEYVPAAVDDAAPDALPPE